MNCFEYEILPFKAEMKANSEQLISIKLYKSEINGVIYNIPHKITNVPSAIKQIHMNYRADEYKVIVSQECNDYPNYLIESTGDCYDYYEHDQLLISIEFSLMGKEYIRISLYKVGFPNPIKTHKFKPNDCCSHNMTLGYDFILKRGSYFLLFDNIEVNLEEFNKYESLIGVDKDIVLRWRGSGSFSPSYYLPNRMLFLPFRIY